MVRALDVNSGPVVECAGVCDRVFRTRCIKEYSQTDTGSDRSTGMLLLQVRRERLPD